VALTVGEVVILRAVSLSYGELHHSLPIRSGRWGGRCCFSFPQGRAGIKPEKPTASALETRAPTFFPWHPISEGFQPHL